MTYVKSQFHSKIFFSTHSQSKFKMSNSQETKESTNTLSLALCKNHSVVLCPRKSLELNVAYNSILRKWVLPLNERYHRKLRIDECKEMIDESNYNRHFHLYNIVNTQVGHISYNTKTCEWKLLSEITMNLDDLISIALKKVKHNSDLLIEDVNSEFRNAIVIIGRKNSEIEYCSKDWKLSIKPDQKNTEALVFDANTPYENENPKIVMLTITSVIKEELEDTFDAFSQLRNANKVICNKNNKVTGISSSPLPAVPRGPSNVVLNRIPPLLSSKESTIIVTNEHEKERKVAPTLNQNQVLELKNDNSNENGGTNKTPALENKFHGIELEASNLNYNEDGKLFRELSSMISVDHLNEIFVSPTSPPIPNLVAAHVFQNFHGFFKHIKLSQTVALIEAGRMAFMIEAGYRNKMTTFVDDALNELYPQHVLFLPKSEDLRLLLPEERQVCQRMLLFTIPKKFMSWCLFELIRDKIFRKCQKIEDEFLLLRTNSPAVATPSPMCLQLSQFLSALQGYAVRIKEVDTTSLKTYHLCSENHSMLLPFLSKVNDTEIICSTDVLNHNYASDAFLYHSCIGTNCTECVYVFVLRGYHPHLTFQDALFMIRNLSFSPLKTELVAVSSSSLTLKDVLEMIETNKRDFDVLKQIVDSAGDLILEQKAMRDTGNLNDRFEKKNEEKDPKTTELEHVLEFIAKNESEDMVDEIEKSLKQRNKRKFAELSESNSLLKIEKEKLEAAAKVIKSKLNCFQKIKDVCENFSHL
jgi:hypothetical protein